MSIFRLTLSEAHANINKLTRGAKLWDRKSKKVVDKQF